uniref:Cytohesin 4 n=1 Tax=Equus asinus asinus TaxID=83772 RepID=A0A8C4PSY1_EQUAS
MACERPAGAMREAGGALTLRQLSLKLGKSPTSRAEAEVQEREARPRQVLARVPHQTPRPWAGTGSRRTGEGGGPAWAGRWGWPQRAKGSTRSSRLPSERHFLHAPVCVALAGTEPTYPPHVPDARHRPGVPLRAPPPHCPRLFTPRQFLWSFRLPGEAQKIDRMMETFATRYCLCNPGVFQSTDTCYVLSFSIIMLNTSLHNPNVRDRPPFERFVSMNRGINGGSDLPEEQLRNLFDSIKSEPFSIPEDDGNDLTHTFFKPDREGWLLKLGGRVKTWKRRWFILTDNCLYYFEFTTDKEPRGIIPLENLSVQKVEDPKKPFCLELYNPSCRGQKIKACKTDGDGKVVEGKHESYRISASSAEERDQWIEAIQASITRDPFYDLVSARKKKIASKH